MPRFRTEPSRWGVPVLAVALLASIIGITTSVSAAPPIADAGTPDAVPGTSDAVYGPPNWLPHRGTADLGCTWNNPPCGSGHGYWALDIAYERNQPIYATGMGEVIIVVDDQGKSCPSNIYPTLNDCPDGATGNVVLIHHGGSTYSFYGHFGDVRVEVGDWVTDGTVIGSAGDSGWTDPGFVHLHYEQWNGLPWEGGSAVVPNDLRGCDAGVTDRYPDVLGFTNWSGPSFGTPMDHDGTCNANGPDCISGFYDVLDSHPFCEEILWQVDEGITTGFSDNLYWPGRTTSRQVALAWLYRYTDPGPGPWPAPPFTDVSPTNPFYTEIRWGVEAEITTGFEDGEFKPTRDVTRQTFVAWLYRLAGMPSGPFPNPGLSDVHPADTFYTEIAWAVHQDIVSGYSTGEFRGGEPITRAGAAAIMNRYDSS